MIQGKTDTFWGNQTLFQMSKWAKCVFEVKSQRPLRLLDRPNSSESINLIFTLAQYLPINQFKQYF